MIHNLHQRELAVDHGRLAGLLDGVAEPGNALWPSHGWPPLRLDRPLAVGATGGHGPIRYSVEAYEPGRRIVFRLDPSMPLVGTHEFEVLPGVEPGHAILRHLIIARPTGKGWLVWPLAVRWLHDALLADLLDRAAVAVGQSPTQPARWSWWVRRLRARSA